MRAATYIPFAALVSVAAQLAAQESPLIRINVDLIQIDAVVTDKQGRIARNLTAADFEIFQDGKKREVSGFSFISSQSESPSKSGRLNRTVVVLVDDLGLSFSSVDITRKGLKKFFEGEIQPGDKVALICTGTGIGSQQGFNTDRHRLLSQVESLRWNPLSRAGTDSLQSIRGPGSPREQQGPTPGSREVGPDPSRESLDRLNSEHFSLGTMGSLSWIVDGLRDVPGRKSVILISEGFRLFSRDGTPTRMVEATRRIAEQAARSATVIYTIDPRGAVEPGLTAADDISGFSLPMPSPFGNPSSAITTDRQDELFTSQGPLAFLASQTGGIFFFNRNFIEEPLNSVLEDQSGFYLLGYAPDANSFDRNFHRLQVRVKTPGLRVRSRAGFYGIDQPEPTAATASSTSGDGVSQLARAIRSPFIASDIPFRLTALFLENEQREPAVQCMMRIDLRSIKFTESADGMRKATIDILAEGTGSGGVARTLNTFNVTTNSEGAAELLRRGAVYSFRFPVTKPGPFHLRVAIRDAGSSAMGSGSQFVFAPDLNRARYSTSGLMLAKRDAVSSATTGGRGDAATREFVPGDELEFAVQVFHSSGADLAGQLRLFSEGKQLLEMPAKLIVVPGPPGSRHRSASGSFRMSSKMPVGRYLLQLTVRDQNSGAKIEESSQWTDFTVVAADVGPEPRP